MSQTAIRVLPMSWRTGREMEDGKRVFAVLDAAFGEDDGDEVDAGAGEEGNGGGVCQKLKIHVSIFQIAA